MKKIGAYFSDNRCEFTVWAPEKKAMQLHLASPVEKIIPMLKDQDGYFRVTCENIPAGVHYYFAVTGESSPGKYPDPASHFQPEGVHGPSEVVDHQKYNWKDIAWRGLPLGDLIFYEIHVGTFTQEGTFEAIIPLLDHLADTGINAIELMPIAQFPGDRNWGYDGVYPFAVQNSYGGPDKLKVLVDAAHQKGIAVFLDVVYNHLGPEGNYFSKFGPYFTDKYATPWGDAINLDGEWSDGVRTYFSNAILHWYENYHLDGLRVDAIHTMYDSGAVHFWELVYDRLSQLKQQLGKNFYLIAESDLNSPRTVKVPENGGLGFSAQWLDDFHHCLYVLLDPAGQDRYEDYGRLDQLAKAYTDGFVYSGEYVKFRKRKHGASSAGLSGDTFVVFNQNHDQVGNRVGGERLSMLVDFERQKLAAAAVLLAPYIPMLFMGEEYGADTPFFYFVSHSEEDLIQMVVEGRRKEFENFKWDVDPPNPQEADTFTRSKLNWSSKDTGDHQVLLRWHKALITLRRTNPALQNYRKNGTWVEVLGEKGFVLHRKSEDEKDDVACIFNLSQEELTYTLPQKYNRWEKCIDSKDEGWKGAGDFVGHDQFPVYVDGGQVIVLPEASVAVYRGMMDR